MAHQFKFEFAATSIYTNMQEIAHAALDQIESSIRSQRAVIEQLRDNVRHQRAEYNRTMDILRLTEQEAHGAQEYAAELLALKAKSAPAEQVVNVTVRAAADDGKLLGSFRVPVDVSVGLLRHAVAARFNLRAYAFKMTYAGKTLTDDVVIRDLGIDVGTDDVIYIRPNFNLTGS